MKFTMWRFVVVLHMYTKFREKIVGKVYHTYLGQQQLATW